MLGYPDKDLPQYKVFNYTINAKSFTKIRYNKKAKIIINRNKQKVYLNAKNKYNKDLNIQISWSFNMLKQRLNLKLKYLAIIKAESRRINNTEYFKYNEIIFYKLKDFETFINLIEAGIINITFMIGLYKKGKRIGETHDHGTAFTINEKQIELLYDRLL